MVGTFLFALEDPAPDAAHPTKITVYREEAVGPSTVSSGGLELASATDSRHERELPVQPQALLEAVKAGLRAHYVHEHLTENTEAALHRLEALTPRELEVLQLLVAGNSNKMAAQNLGVSPRTIEFHRAHIMAKTGVRNLADLVRLWTLLSPVRVTAEDDRASMLHRP